MSWYSLVCSTVSNMFYGGRLVSATELALNSPKGNALFFWDVSQEEFEVKGRKGRIQNRQEAEAAAVLACDAIHKNPASLVFIICAYAAQVSKSPVPTPSDSVCSFLRCAFSCFKAYWELLQHSLQT